MEKSKIFIPKVCKVGFQKRGDTYTKRLGYIIAKDGDTWRKENSWENWRTKYISDEEYMAKKEESFLNSRESYKKHYEEIKNKGKVDSWEWRIIEGCDSLEDFYKKTNISTLEEYCFNMYGFSNDEYLKPFEFENIPTSGFVLNKKAGGYSTGWNYRQSYIRVYDPRNIEIEISIENLLYILENSTSTVGKGLEGEFVYGWDGKDLVLIPTISPEYTEIKRFNNLRSEKSLSKSELVLGNEYTVIASGIPINVPLTYLGESMTYYNNIPDKKELWFGYQEADNIIIRTLSISSIKSDLGPSSRYHDYLEVLSKNEKYNPSKKVNIITSDFNSMKELNDYIISKDLNIKSIIGKSKEKNFKIQFYDNNNHKFSTTFLSGVYTDLDLDKKLSEFTNLKFTLKAYEN